MKNKFLIIVLGFGWLTLVSGGLAKLYNYEFKPAQENSIVTHWPEESRVQRDKNPFQLVMVVHPRCPCSRATIHQLERIIANAQDKLSVYLLFTQPKSFSKEWVETDLFYLAQEIPHVHILLDEDGQEARLFGGTASGQTFLFDASGNLLFSGGITASRGHEGDNAGMNAILTLLQNKEIELTQTPAFGCPLYNKNYQVSKVSAQGRGENVN